MGVAVGVIVVVGMGSEMVESDRVGMVDGAVVVVEEVACCDDEDDGVKVNLFREPKGKLEAVDVVDLSN